MKVSSVLESCLYAEDLDRAEKFYTGVLGLEVIRREEGRHVFFRCGEAVVLIFNADKTSSERTKVDGQDIPLHGSHGEGHLAFRSSQSDLPRWENHLESHGIEIESKVVWPGGGKSIYFRDPAGNSIELASPRIWGLPENTA